VSAVEENSVSQTESVSRWQRLRGFRIPEGQSLVWSLINLERGLPRQIIAFIAFILTFRFIFSWSWSLSLAMIVSMFLHECGHASVFWVARIRFIILYLFPLGAVAAPIDKEEDARSDLLHWNTISWLLQAGPAVNVALILIFLLIQPAVSAAVQDSGVLLQFCRDMVYVNGLLASMNLVPVWTLDAGQLFNVLYNSLEETEDNWLTGILLGSTFVLVLFIIGVPGFISWALILANTLTRFGWVAFLAIFAVGILNKQGRDDPMHAFSKQAMNNRQVIVQLAVYILLVGITLWVFAGPIG
jgi:Zn-dependent protease